MLPYTSDKSRHYPDPLPDGYIRLLVVEPSTESDEQIICSLKHQKLSSYVEYEALSYTWGNEQASVAIIVNQEPFWCRKNLFEALKRLRCSTLLRVLWVDAICINQADTAERNHQVRQMKTIYTNAQVVNVWLGESTDPSDRAMDLLRTMNTRLKEANRGRQPIRVGSTWRDDSESGFTANPTMTFDQFEDYYDPILSILRSPQGIEDLDAAVDLLRRPWWNRMWTLQESVLGRNVVVTCGSKTIDFSCFFELSYFIFLALSFGVWKGSHIDSTARVRAAWCIADLRDYVHLLGHVSFLFALDSSWSREVSDPRDRVFGLLGLLGSRYNIEPDYSRTTDQVYCAAFADIVVQDKNLLFLGLMVEDRRLKNPKLPSWVPDLELHSDLTSDYISSLSKPVYNSHVYDASLQGRRADSSISVDNTGRVLVVQGVLVDTVARIGNKAPPKIMMGDEQIQAWREEMNLALENWRSLIPQHPYYTPTAEPFVRAFWRCVLTDLKQGPLHAKFDPGKPNRLDQDDHQTVSQFESDEAREKLVSFWAGFSRLESKQLRLVEQLNRRFFITSEGLMGLGPPWLSPGDAICVLLGGTVAYALRRAISRGWMYVGECYVHGIMDGEIIKEVDRGHRTYQTFEIS